MALCELEQIKTEIDLLQLIEAATGEKPRKYGNKVKFEKCPFCSHKNHFFYYPSTRSYSSFAKCCQGGSIIDWLVEHEGYEKSEAIKKVYDIAGTSTEYNVTELKAKRLEMENKKASAEAERQKINLVFDKLCSFYQMFKEIKRSADENEADKLTMAYQFILWSESFFNRYTENFINSTYEQQKQIAEKIQKLYEMEWENTKDWLVKLCEG